MTELRDHPQCAREQFEAAVAPDDPGLNVQLTFDPDYDVAAPYIATAEQVVKALNVPFDLFFGQVLAHLLEQLDLEPQKALGENALEVLGRLVEIFTTIEKTVIRRVKAPSHACRQFGA